MKVSLYSYCSRDRPAGIQKKKMRMANMTPLRMAARFCPNSSMPQAGSMAIHRAEKPSGFPEIRKKVKSATISVEKRTEAIMVPDLPPFLIRMKFTRHRTEKTAVAIVSAPLRVITFSTVMNKETQKKRRKILLYCSSLRLLSSVRTALSFVRTAAAFFLHRLSFI